MAFIKQVKTVEKSQVKIPASKDIADAFNKELELYQKTNQGGNVLDFDPLVKKLVGELTKINAVSKAE